MGHFFVSGLNKHGKKKVLRVEAETAREALAEAEARGLTDPVLETDEVSALILQDGPDISENFTDDEQLQMRRGSKWQNRLALFGKLLRQLWLMWGAGLAIIVQQRIQGHPWGAADATGLALILGAFVLAILIQFWPRRTAQTVRLYDGLMAASGNADWNRVLELVDQLQSHPVPKHELAFQTAFAQAAHGHLDEALQTVDPWVRGIVYDPQCPEWLARSRLSDVYGFAGKWEAAQESIETAFEMSPDTSIMQLDVAMSRIRFGDIDGAEDILDHIEPTTVSRELQPILSYVEASVANEHGRPEEALAELLPAQLEMQKHVATCAIWKPLLAAVELEIAISYALGDAETESARYLKKAAPSLIAHNDRPRIERAERLTRRSRCPIQIDRT